MHEADGTGTAFRYAGQLPDKQHYLDFPDLVTVLDDEFRMLGAVEDSITEPYTAGPQPEDESGFY